MQRRAPRDRVLRAEIGGEVALERMTLVGVVGSVGSVLEEANQMYPLDESYNYTITPHITARTSGMTRRRVETGHIRLISLFHRATVRS